jgi:hypothetical protein
LQTEEKTLLEPNHALCDLRERSISRHTRETTVVSQPPKLSKFTESERLSLPFGRHEESSEHRKSGAGSHLVGLETLLEELERHSFCVSMNLRPVHARSIAADFQSLHPPGCTFRSEDIVPGRAGKDLQLCTRNLPRIPLSIGKRQHNVVPCAHDDIHRNANRLQRRCTECVPNRRDVFLRGSGTLRR